MAVKVQQQYAVSLGYVYDTCGEILTEIVALNNLIQETTQLLEVKSKDPNNVIECIDLGSDLLRYQAMLEMTTDTLEELLNNANALSPNVEEVTP